MSRNLDCFMEAAEERLPEGQKPIETKGVRKLRTFMKLVMDQAKINGHSKMGVITGESGAGKTTAVKTFADEFQPLSHTGISPVVKVRVVQDSTPKALALGILRALGEYPRGKNRYELADEVCAALKRNDITLLVVDEADRLNDVSFELLRYIHDMTGYPIVLVGLEGILRVIRRQDKFRRRVGWKLEFPSPTEDELLNLVLPQITLARWSYDPGSKTDRKMGTFLFKKAGSSYGEIVKLLANASEMAVFDGEGRISLATLREASGMTFLEKKSSPQDRNEEDDDQTELGDYELRSERRHEAKDKKQKEDR